MDIDDDADADDDANDGDGDDSDDDGNGDDNDDGGDSKRCPQQKISLQRAMHFGAALKRPSAQTVKYVNGQE